MMCTGGHGDGYFTVCYAVLMGILHMASGLDRPLTCRSNLSGGNYRGTVNTTLSGRRCQRWDAKVPHRHDVTPVMLGEQTLTAAADFCRSPDFDPGGPWCFTMDPRVEWEYCNVPRCNDDGCRETESGVHYIGSVNRTVTGQLCMQWSEVVIFIQYGYTNYPKTAFPDEDRKHSSCRNPLGSRDRPWCHVTPEDEAEVDLEDSWQFCDVPMCDRQNTGQVTPVIENKACQLAGGMCMMASCCPRENYTTTLCANGLVCCLQAPDCAWRQQLEFAAQWPEGSYGLLMPIFGCPSNDAFEWLTGRIQMASAMGVGMLGNLTSEVGLLHIQGPFTDVLTLNICLRDQNYVKVTRMWPRGSYCILQYKGSCPLEFEGFTIKVHDRMKDFSVTYEIDPSCDLDPEKMCLNICCRDDDPTDKPIDLPPDQAFYLLKHGQYCQNVKDMNVTEEKLHLVLGPDHTANSTLDSSTIFIVEDGLVLNLCYYEISALKGCFDPVDGGFFYRGRVNMTEAGGCSNWEDIEMVSQYKQYDYVGLDNNNFCRNTVIFEFEDRPWCYANGQKVLCGIPQCDDISWEDYELVSRGRPARQAIGDKAQLANDGLIDTCSKQAMTHAWWQVDLQGWYHVVGVRLYRLTVDACVIRMANIHVGQRPDDFLHSGALLCARNVSVGASVDPVVRCTQPVIGQFVTVENLAYIDWESGMRPYENCLDLCEVVVYVQDSHCGRRLLERSRGNEIQPILTSSSGDTTDARNYILQNDISWCGEAEGVDQWIKVELLFPRRIQGVSTQGHQTLEQMVTAFTLESGLTEAHMVPYEDYSGVQKVFRNNPEDKGPQLHTFLTEISARIVMLHVKEFIDKPCLRFDIIGCVDNFENLIEPNGVAQSSTPKTSKMADMAVDGDTSTCSETTLENAAWWMTSLNSHGNLHSVVLKTSTAFLWNLAVKRPPLAISTGWDGFPWRTNDGDRNNDFWGGSCCHTFLHDYPWWAVELDDVSLVTSVHVTNRGDCCETRLNKFILYVGSAVPVEGSALNTSLYEVCATHDDYFTAGETRAFTCATPLYGKYVVLYVNNAQHYLTVCEVEVYGERAPFLVGVLPTPPPGGVISSTDSCEATSQIPPAGFIHSYSCPPDNAGAYLSTQAGGRGPISLCEVIAFGGSQAKIEDMADGDSVMVSCNGAETLHLERLNDGVDASGGGDSTSGRVYIEKEQLVEVLHLCEGKDKCVLPTVQAMSKGAAGLSLFCSERAGPDAACQMSISSEMTIQTPNFPYYYGLDLDCRWEIKAPAGKFVVLNITWITILGPVEKYRDGCLEVNTGNCTDVALVNYGETGMARSGAVGAVDSKSLTVSQPSLYVSDTDRMTVNFRSCYRNTGLTGDWTKRLGMRGDISFEDCQGCKAQDVATLLDCSGQCGQIMSRGFPNGYSQRERTLWTIRVETGNYVTLTFEDFDVYERPLVKCLKDYVEVRDVNLIGGQSPLGRYCNSERPPALIKSSWSELVVLFSSDMEISGRGFHAIYRQKEYQLEADFPPSGPDPGCPSNWTRFLDNCYTLVTWHQPLTWLASEVECRKSGGHLVAINSRQEMVFLHYMLTTEWRTRFFRTFIGLNDRVSEGKYRWIDGSPVTYTDWSPSSSYDNVQQPDGADVEDCVMIRLDSVHDTRSWHDIPCAYDKVQQFLCEAELSAGQGNDNDTLSMMLELPKPSMTSLTDTFLCDNGELVLSQYRCDGTSDCHDGSDENYCQTDGCSEVHFQCRDSTCISITYYCDFKSHCPDGSDEDSCVKQSCQETDFMCANGQCISGEKRCNLLVDCQDGSDEQACDQCALGVAFQCFDGGCIPREKRCDGVVDCPGSLHEDESAECSQETAENSCLDWKVAGKTDSGPYRIQPPGVEGFEVECDMTSYADYVLTTVHHDVEQTEYITGYSKPGDYVKHLNYDLSREQLVAVMAAADHCEQYVRVDCFASSGLGNDFWLNGAGDKRTWNDDKANNCTCLLTSSCTADNKKCMCQKADIIVPRVMTTDEGYLTDRSDLPMTAISLSGTGFAGAQYQYHYVGPLVCYQYANKSRDDLRCRTGQWINRAGECLAYTDRYGDPSGCRDMSHLQGCENKFCPDDFLKCSEGHCIPLQSVCDDTWDCINGEDELQCENYTCPGQFRCLAENICITQNQRCDGVRQCHHGNDEWHCDVTCPSECSCVGLSFSCPDLNMTAFPSSLSMKARKIDFSGNWFELNLGMFEGYVSLGELILRSNGITELPVGVFSPLVNLYLLDLMNNNIASIFSNTFEGLGNLRILKLDGNPQLHTIHPFAFAGLEKIASLNLKGLGIRVIKAQGFGELPSLKGLNLAENDLTMFSDVLVGLNKLTELNLTSNSKIDIAKKEFSHVPSLKYLQSDYFKYCCFVKERVPEEQCLPERDQFSSCEDLMRRDLLKVFLWVLGLMAFLCNLFVLIYRRSERLTIYSFCVMNLAVSDFLMGLYMVVMASVDAYYRGVYIEYADAWTNSWACQFLGFLNTFSSETSVFTLCVISADRFYKIVFPLHASKFDMRKAKLVMACVWLLGFTLAALPLLPIGYFGYGSFYGRSSVCISIYLTKEFTPGWQFSVSLFHGFNFFSFIFIFIAYTYLFHVVKQGNKKTKKFTHGHKPNQNDIALARRLTLVVFTDFLCWVPINIMGAAAGAGASIPGEVYAWVVVFLLPINSAINPMLYTISSIRLKAKQAKAKESNSLSAGASSLLVYFSEGEQTEVDLKTYLSQFNPVTLSTLLKVAQNTAFAIKEAHSKGYTCAGLDATTVFVKGDAKGHLDIGVNVAVDSLNDQSEDMLAFGKLTSYLLRRMVPTK